MQFDWGVDYWRYKKESQCVRVTWDIDKVINYNLDK